MSAYERFEGKGLERELSYAVKTCDETGLPHAVCADDYTAGGYNVNRPSRFYEFVRAKIGEMSNDAAVESIEPGDKPGYRYTVIHVHLGDAHLSLFHPEQESVADQFGQLSVISINGEKLP